jgi:hypothetical protein
MSLFPIMIGLAYETHERINDARNAGVTQLVVGLPWEMILPHDKQARRNHDQTLQRLAERGGLSACEALAVLEDRSWHELRLPFAEAHRQLAERLARWESDQKHEAQLVKPDAPETHPSSASG